MRTSNYRAPPRTLSIRHAIETLAIPGTLTVATGRVRKGAWRGTVICLLKVTERGFELSWMGSHTASYRGAEACSVGACLPGASPASPGGPGPRSAHSASLPSVSRSLPGHRLVLMTPNTDPRPATSQQCGPVTSLWGCWERSGG